MQLLNRKTKTIEMESGWLRASLRLRILTWAVRQWLSYLLEETMDDGQDRRLGRDSTH
jgi:hypothetical protein